MFNNGFYAPDPSVYQTPFFFDIIYEYKKDGTGNGPSSVTELQTKAKNDGVFIGRFILTTTPDEPFNELHEVVWQKAIDDNGMYYQKIAKIGAENAIEMIEQAIKDAEKATKDANEAATDAEKATKDANEAATDAEKATKDANTAARAANNALDTSEKALFNANAAIEAIEKTTNEFNLNIAWQIF